jgi:hypothetical protein
MFVCWSFFNNIWSNKHDILDEEAITNKKIQHLLILNTHNNKFVNFM